MGKAFPIRHCTYIGEPAENHVRYRRIIPAKLRGRFDGRKEWSKTFPRGTSLGEIENTAKALATQHRALIARAKAGEIIGPAVIEQAEKDAAVFLAGDKATLYEYQAFLAQQTAGLPRNSSLPFAVQLNALEHGGKFVPEMVTLAGANETRDGERNQRDVASAINAFVKVVGERDVRAIRRADVKRFVAHELARNVKPSAVRRRCVSLQGIITDYFDEKDIDQPNPFARLEIAGSAPSVDDRYCFHRKMMDDIDAYVAKSNRIKPETRNTLTLIKYTGAGPNEIGGLALADVVLDHEIPHIIIRKNDTRGLKVRAQGANDKRSPRERRIPLLGPALDAARNAVERAKRRRAKPKDRLFTRGFGKNGRKADGISANLNALIDRAGIKSKKHTLYSYRHTFKEALVAADVPENLRRQLMGHTRDGEPRQRRQSDAHDNYGGRRPLIEARDALQKALFGVDDKGVPFFGNVATDEPIREAAE